MFVSIISMWFLKMMNEFSEFDPSPTDDNVSFVEKLSVISDEYWSIVSDPDEAEEKRKKYFAKLTCVYCGVMHEIGSNQMSDSRTCKKCKIELDEMNNVGWR